METGSGSMAVPSPPAPSTPVQTRCPPPAESGPTRIVAQSIGLDAPVEEVEPLRAVDAGGAEILEWPVPDQAAGFHRESAFPGHRGNTVISGHNNIGGEVFRRLIDLAIGDDVYIHVGQVAYRYRVEEKHLVREAGASTEEREENARWIAPTEDERLTLVTCWPDWGNSHRLIVVARPPR